MFLNKKLFILSTIAIIIFCLNNIIFCASSLPQPGGIASRPAAQTSQVSPNQTPDDTYIDLYPNTTRTGEFNLIDNVWDLSLPLSFGFRSKQTVFSIGFQAGYFIASILETGFKISTEKFIIYYDEISPGVVDTGYSRIVEFSIFTKLYLLKKSSTIPFITVDFSYAYSKGLSGFAIKPGIGLFQGIKGIFNIYLVLFYDIWFYKYNIDSNVTHKCYGKTHTDFRVQFGFSFFLRKNPKYREN